MKTLLWHVLLYAQVCLLGMLVFVALFQTPLFFSSIFFYRGILLLEVTSVLLFIFLVCVRRMVPTSTFGYKDILLSVMMMWCITLVVFTHLPVTADRSVTVYILGLLNRNKGHALSESDISESLIRTYIMSHKAVEKRLAEQRVIGTIKKEGDGYTVTPRGERTVKLYLWMSDMFGLGRENLSE